MTRIAILAPAFPAPTHTFILRELKALCELGADVRVFSTRRPRRRFEAAEGFSSIVDSVNYLTIPGIRSVLGLFPRKARSNLKEFVSAACSEGKVSLKDFLICLPYAMAFAERCRKDGIDHIHVHMASRSALTAAIASRISGIPYSITHHGRLSDFGLCQPFKWRKAKFGIIITRYLLDELRAEISDDAPRDLVVQPMGVDSERFKRTRPYEPRKSDETFRLFSCGRLHRIKGHDILVRAVAQLVAAGEDIRLEFAGGEPYERSTYKRELEELIARLGVEKHVKLAGILSEDGVRSRLLEAHGFALASRFEPFGVVYLEAMSCGVPTIGTRQGGVPEIIVDGESGFLVPPDDPKALADRIRVLMRDETAAERMSRTARSTVKDRFPIDASARIILDRVGAAPDQVQGQSAWQGF